ncbi:MAG: amidohydrolase family protein [Chthoniobacterales bacterium]|nr:amidohydrolase family protein [Chthoniobacterales bacterium]
MILRARTVVTMERPPIDNGAIAIHGDRIVDVGKFPEIRARNAGQAIDLQERMLLPGLINAHCHLDYTRLRGKIPRRISFTDWIQTINAEKAKLSQTDYLASIREGFAEAKKFGATTMANLTAFPELIPRLRAPIRVWWFAELIDVRAPGQANTLVDSAAESARKTEHWGLAPHALFTASAAVYRRCEQMARAEQIPLTTHLAESREEMLMFRHASGPLYEFLKSIGRAMDDCGQETPLERFLRITELGTSKACGARCENPWMVAHLNELIDRDFELLRNEQVKFHVAHCPRSHAYFGHTPFAFERLSELGLNICLGTDSLASNDNLSLFAEMRAFQRGQPGVSPERIVAMATVNGARALGMDQVLGRIRRGFRADLIAIPSAPKGNPFEQIVAFDGTVDWIMIGGKT